MPQSQPFVNDTVADPAAVPPSAASTELDHRARLQSAMVLLMGIGLFLALPFVLSIGAVVFLPPVTAVIFTIVLSPLADRLIRLDCPTCWRRSWRS